MPANIKGLEMLEQKEIHESAQGDYSYIGLGDESESEINWVKLHQMFDR